MGDSRGKSNCDLQMTEVENYTPVTLVGTKMGTLNLLATCSKLYINLKQYIYMQHIHMQIFTFYATSNCLHNIVGRCFNPPPPLPETQHLK